MKYSSIKAAIVAFSIFLFSCSPNSGLGASMRLDTRSSKPDAAMTKKIQAVVNIAAQLGWKTTALPSKILKGNPADPNAISDALGYRLVTLDEKNKLNTLLAWSTRDRDKLTAAFDQKSIAYQVFPLEHCRPWINKDSPLPASASTWPRIKLIEWLVWEWSAKTLLKKDAARESAVDYAVKTLTPEIARVQIGADSIELTQWQDAFRDKVTFYTLASDLATQIEGILAAQSNPTERDLVMHRIQRAWFNDYTTNYPNRFLTNGYVDFGKNGYLEPLSVLGMGFSFAGIRNFEKTVKFSSKDIPKFFEELAVAK